MSRINTVVVAILTSNLSIKDAPGNVFLTKQSTKLPKDSVANVSQIVTLDKSFLTEYSSRLSSTIGLYYCVQDHFEALEMSWEDRYASRYWNQ